MESILEKISSYNLFNYLLPGVVLCVVSDRYFDIPLLQDSIITGLFLYYFVGLVTSRFGSIVLEPILKKLKIVKFAQSLPSQVKAKGLFLRIAQKKA